MGSRQTASDPNAGDEEDDRQQTMSEPADMRTNRHSGPASTQVLWDEVSIRQLQLARGAAPHKMIASRTALQSLQSVGMADLPANEKSKFCFRPACKPQTRK